jgi:Fe2+ or Zn2+ uptake regulation protein
MDLYKIEELIWTLDKLNLTEVEITCGLCGVAEKHHTICLKCQKALRL